MHGTVAFWIFSRVCSFKLAARPPLLLFTTQLLRRENRADFVRTLKLPALGAPR